MLLRMGFIGVAVITASSSTRSTSAAPVGAQYTFVAGHCDRTSGRGASLRNYIVPIVTGVGSAADRVRNSLSLPAGQASIVTIVTNDSVCTAVYLAQVRLKHGGDSTLVGPIGLVQVGSDRYVVEDVSRRAGEWALLDVYDTSLNYLASITR